MRSTCARVAILLFILNTCNGLLDKNGNTVTIEIEATLHDNDVCKVCEEVIGNIISLRRSGANQDTMRDYLTKSCNIYTDDGAVACNGYVKIQLDTILYIIDHKKDLTPARFCGIRFRSYNCVDPNAESWTVPLPPLPSNAATQQISQQSSDPVEILHLTDFHYDPLYTPGSNAKCDIPLCCETGVPDKPEDAAGYWGDYQVCDTPWHSVENLMERVKEKHKNIDWIYFTGDIVNHRSWTTSIQSNSESIRNVLQIFAKTFPDKKVYPILGNHESHPGDYYAPDYIDKNLNVSTQWIYDLSVEEWSRWLPNSTLDTIRKGGFYTVLVKPGFRIIALNSAVCYTGNLWLVYDDKDPYNQLQWLVDILTQAEKNGEKVHILSHVAPGDPTCVRQWSYVFKKIVLRFSNTIAAQFNGHSHTDEFRLFFDSPKLDEAKNVAFNGASFTTFIGNNPNYRIYEVEENSMMVSDYSEYIYNMTKANENSKSPPEWFKLYSFKEAYGLPDLQLKSLGKLYWKMASNNSDNDLVEKYYRYMNKDSDVFIKKGCNSKCKKSLVCTIAATETDETNSCI